MAIKDCVKIHPSIRSLIAATILIATASAAKAEVWATAVSRNEQQGTAIVYRFMKEFAPNFSRSAQPDRIIIVWRYDGEKGMPSRAEQKRMNELEDALSPLQEDGFSSLAIVSTGDNFKEWTYYTRAEAAFFERLNVALRSRARFPVEIHACPDPEWTTYDRFIKGLKQ